MSSERPFLHYSMQMGILLVVCSSPDWLVGGAMDDAVCEGASAVVCMLIKARWDGRKWANYSCTAVGAQTVNVYGV